MRGNRSRNAVAPVVVAAVVAVVAGMFAGACASPAPSTPTPRPTLLQAPGCVVGASWNNLAEGRIYDWDERRFKALVEYAGGIYKETDAKSSSDQQSSDIDSLVAAGAKVILVRAQDGGAILPALRRAEDAGVSVVAYDRLIEDPKALYITYDAVEIGRLEARAILAARPRGNYVIIKGDSADPTSDLMASGIHEVLQPAVDRGDIHIVGETYTHWWDPADAQTETAGFLAQNANRLDAAIAESDGMAGGVVAALEAVGLDGKVSVAGQGGDEAELSSVAMGTQTVDVWPDRHVLAATAARAAIELCNNSDVSRVDGVMQYKSPGGNQLASILLEPDAITRDNLKDVIDAGWTTRQTLCFRVDPSNAPPACQ